MKYNIKAPDLNYEIKEYYGCFEPHGEYALCLGHNIYSLRVCNYCYIHNDTIDWIPNTTIKEL